MEMKTDRGMRIIVWCIIAWAVLLLLDWMYMNG